MRILSRYFLWSYLSLFFGTLFISVVTIVIVEMLVHFDVIFSTANQTRDILEHLFLRIPAFYLADLVPIASFLAAFLCTGIPARHHEFTAIKAGGISPLRVVIPILLASALLSGASLVANETLVLRASADWQRFGQPPGLVEYEQGVFWYRSGDDLFRVGEADAERRILSDVMVLQLDPQGHLVQTLRAPRVRIEGDHLWRFENSTTRTYDRASPNAPPRIERSKESALEIGSQRNLALLSADPAGLTLSQLYEYIELRDHDGRSSLRSEALLHSRATQPLLVFVFTLMALPLGLSVGPTRSFSIPAAQGAFLLAIFLTGRNAAGLAPDLTPAIPLPWVFLFLFTGFCAWRLSTSLR
ncbi:LptF/LptG family permease [Myxococcota bacterium]|nr:LptF/LptG family permease [Myxococcota bacterium]